jgi:Pentapeptide repeats (8 copies)
MEQPASRLMALAVGAVVLLLASVLAFPRLLHPPLSPGELQVVANPERRIELQQRQAELQNDARATLLQGVAGLLLVVGAVATWRQLQISREGQITERFSRAVDQLGNDKQDVRLGGLYTLERIAADSPADRRTVQAVLGAYVRTHAPWLVGSPKGPEHPTPTVDRQLPWLQHRATDVQAAMAVLGRRPTSRNELQLYLSRVDLRGAFLYDARLSNALLRHTNLARAQMPGAQLERADLEDTDLRQANLQRARLTGANLHHAYLQDADLRGADLSRADLHGANFQGAQLEGADLTGARFDDTTVWPAGFKPS